MRYFNKKNNLILATIILSLPIFCLSFYFWYSSDPKNAQAEPVKQSHDVVGLRVISKGPDDQFLGAKDWAQKNGFGGAETMIIDDYRAVRSGRSIYVNVANTDQSGTYFFNNIYVLSYNQDPDQATVDIFRKLISHWKFNINLDQPGKCSHDNDLDCQYDVDCAELGFCLSDKAKVTRDTWRMEDLAHIKLAIEKYNEKYGSYPTLPAGTYISGNTISTWPSWQDEFGSRLGISLPLDPRNKLGPCQGYDSITCWNNLNKKFVTDLDVNGTIVLPDDSYSYYYWASSDGSNVKICTILESSQAITNFSVIGNTFCL